MNRTYQILPPKGLIGVNFAELWRYKELFFVFVWRDIKVRYKQTFFGIAWAIIQPFIMMVVFSIFFGNFAQISSDDVPYPIFLYTGLLFWNYFVTALTNSSNCLIEQETLVKKIFFPRLILPLSTILTPAIDFIFSGLIYLAMMIFYKYNPGLIGLLSIPILLVCTALSATGLGLLLSSINAQFRDVRYILPFFIQLLLFVTPVIYSPSIIPSQFRWIMFLNPMTGIITTARSVILHSYNLDWNMLLISSLSCLLMLTVGLMVFNKTERFFADML
jgi:lipopolysaccharide transport system permease protein